MDKQNKTPIWQKALIVAGAIFIATILFGFGSGLTTPAPAKKTMSREAEINSNRNVFVSGCTKEGQLTSDCQCYFDRLMGMYPDFIDNQPRIDRILAQGYNQDETDEIIKCMN